MSAYEEMVRRVAQALKDVRPTQPETTSDTPHIQVWRQWHADVIAISTVLCENPREVTRFRRTAGADTGE